MMKKRYYFILIAAGLVVLALKLQSFVQKPARADVAEQVQTLPPYNPAVEIESTLEQFDSLLEANLKNSGTVGAAAVITYKGQIVMTKCYGVRKAGTNDPVDQNTVFRLASVSKPITGVLAGILDDENIVKLDDKVAHFIPGFSLKNKNNTDQLEIKHLLSHTSGLIPHAYDLMVEDHVPLEKIIERLPEVDIAAEPGQIYAYQNVMYSLIDPVIQAKTKKSFKSVIQEKVFDPMQMKDASIGYEEFKSSLNKAYPHFNQGHNRFKPMRLNDRYYSTAPAAGINASISDLGHLMANLTAADNPYLSKKVRQTIFSPQVKSPLSNGYFRSWGRGVQSKSYSIGWRIVDYKGRRIAYHGGFVSGYKAEIAVCEEEEIGIALLTNSPNSESAQNIPNFLNLLFAEKDKLAQQQTREKMRDDQS